MSPGLVRVLAVGLAMIGMIWTLLSIFGHPERARSWKCDHMDSRSGSPVERSSSMSAMSPKHGQLTGVK
jgi:hypothetical protein